MRHRELNLFRPSYLSPTRGVARGSGQQTTCWGTCRLPLHYIECKKRSRNIFFSLVFVFAQTRHTTNDQPSRSIRLECGFQLGSTPTFTTDFFFLSSSTLSTSSTTRGWPLVQCQNKHVGEHVFHWPWALRKVGEEEKRNIYRSVLPNARGSKRKGV